jgi:hypothetical protein
VEQRAVKDEAEEVKGREEKEDGMKWVPQESLCRGG